jgi:hypothetical protein
MSRRQPTQEERDERVTLPLDPEQALRGLLAVDPDDLTEDESKAADASESGD